MLAKYCRDTTSPENRSKLMNRIDQGTKTASVSNTGKLNKFVRNQLAVCGHSTAGTAAAKHDFQQYKPTVHNDTNVVPLQEA